MPVERRVDAHRRIQRLREAMLLGILSDAHGHVGGFLEGLRLLRNAGVAEVYFLGDAIGYVPSVEVLGHLKKGAVTCIRGNHEAMLLESSFDEARDEVYRFGSISGLLTADDLSYMKAWPEKLSRTVDGRRLLFVHGSPTDPTFGYVYPDADLGSYPARDFDVVFMGNTHRPFARRHQGALYVNVGSCGLPRDNVGKGSVCIYDSARDEAELVRFDISGSASELLEDPEIHPSVKRHLKRSVDGSRHE